MSSARRPRRTPPPARSPPKPYLSIRVRAPARLFAGRGDGGLTSLSLRSIAPRAAAARCEGKGARPSRLPTTLWVRRGDARGFGRRDFGVRTYGASSARQGPRPSPDSDAKDSSLL